MVTGLMARYTHKRGSNALPSLKPQENGENMAQKGHEPYKGDNAQRNAEKRRQRNRHEPLRRVQDERDNPQLFAGSAHDIRGPDIPAARLPGIDPFEPPQHDPHGNGPKKVGEDHQQRVQNEVYQLIREHRRQNNRWNSVLSTFAFPVIPTKVGIQEKGRSETPLYHACAPECR